MKCCHFFWLAVVITFLLVLRHSYEKRSISVTCTNEILIKLRFRGERCCRHMFCVIFDFSLLSLTVQGIRTFEKRKAILSWLLNSVSEHSYRLEKCLFAIFSHDIKNRIVFTNSFVSAWLICRPVLSAKQRLNPAIEHLLFSY